MRLLALSPTKTLPGLSRGNADGAVGLARPAAPGVPDPEPPGRAHRDELFGLIAEEIGEDLHLERILNTGYLPAHYLAGDYILALRGYVEDYLREEILREGLQHNIPTFDNFIRIAAIGDTEVTNFANIARECGLSNINVREYYSILSDTLPGVFLPAYTRRPKRRTLHGSKYYFRNIGVVNYLTERLPIRKGSEIFGRSKARPGGIPPRPNC